MKYDFIGDIHGYAAPLRALLKKLGYRLINNIYRHPDPQRIVVFLGDYIDRGPDQLEVINIVRNMRDAGTAILLMGNHELNAIGYYHKNPNSSSNKHLRIRGSKNRAQHKIFIDAVGEDSQLHKEIIDFFMSLSLAIENDAFCAVHACWQPSSINIVKAHLDKNGAMNSDLLKESFILQHPLYNPVEILLKGIEIDLPEGYSFFDAGGHERKKSRLQWWNNADNYRDAVIMEKGLENLPLIALPEDKKFMAPEKPVFFGHYWMKGQPAIISDKIACLDFSIAKGGVLSAYMFDGEESLDAKNLVWV